MLNFQYTLCICIYMSMYIPTLTNAGNIYIYCTCMHTHKHMHTNVYLCLLISVYMHTYKLMHTHVHVCIMLYTCTHILMHCVQLSQYEARWYTHHSLYIAMYRHTHNLFFWLWVCSSILGTVTLSYYTSVSDWQMISISCHSVTREPQPYM